MHGNSAPLRFAERRLADFDPAGHPKLARALEAAQALAAGEIENLVLSGPTGVGKTHLAAGVVNAIKARNRASYEAAMATNGSHDSHPRQPVEPLWVNVVELIVGLRDEIGRPVDDRDSTALSWAAAGRKALVVLDDLGQGKTTDWTAETIYGIVNHRYEAKLPTLVTTYLTGAQLSESPYWPVISRLAEDGRLVTLEGPDRRLARAKP